MSTPNSPRLKDVAAEANVSLSAASRILRGDRGRFSAETCERVIAVSERLGWRPNLLVSGMQSGSTKTIGVLIPPYDSFWVRVLSGIHTKLAAVNYLPITVWIGDLDEMPHFEKDEDAGLRQINRLLDRRVDGLIMWPQFSLAYYHHFPEFVERRVPVAVIDHYSTVADSVETNEQDSAKQVADYLVKLGHRRIAYLSSRETPTQTWAIERRSSFEKAMSAYEHVELKSWHLNRDGSNGLEVARNLLTDELRPTAVFAASDHEALPVYEVAAELGKRIPEDISVVGFADLDFASTLQPALTTVQQKPKEIGRRAAQLVLDRLEGKLDNEEQVTVRVNADLVIRDSTGPAAG
jgi:LacI family transcriptional regulator